MDTPAFEVDRRMIMRLGLATGLASLVGGCASGGGGYASADTPSPLWPEGLGKDAAGGSKAPIIVGRETPQTLPNQTPAGPVAGVMPRSAWTREGVMASRANPMASVRRITIHHAAIDSTDLRTADDVIARLRSIRRDHMNRRPEPFADIGYHYVIDPQGRVWEGRPLRYQGAHVAEQNESNLGIMLLGNFTYQQPTNSQINALDSFVGQQMRRYGVPVSRVYTHRELGKSTCPGVNLQNYMDRTRGSGGRLRNA